MGEVGRKKCPVPVPRRGVDMLVAPHMLEGQSHAVSKASLSPACLRRRRNGGRQACAGGEVTFCVEISFLLFKMKVPTEISSSPSVSHMQAYKVQNKCFGVAFKKREELNAKSTKAWNEGFRSHGV